MANKFASDGVKMVVGDYNSGVSIPASDVYLDAGIIQVTPASTNVKFTERGMWNTFRTCGRDDQQGAVAGTYLAEHFKGKKIAFVHDKTPYGKGLADETLKALKAKGGKDAMYEGINPGEKDYSALVSKLKSANVDVVYFGGYYTEAGLILRQMRDQGLKAPMMGGDGMVDRELVAIAGPAAEGTLTTFPPDARKNPNAKAALAAFKAKNIDPEGYTLYSYAAVQVLAKAMAETGSSDGKKLAEWLHQGKPVDTVVGPIALRQEGRHHAARLRHVRVEEGRRRQDRLHRQRADEVSRATVADFRTDAAPRHPRGGVAVFGCGGFVSLDCRIRPPHPRAYA